MTIENRTISVVIALLLAAVPGGAVAQGDGADADRDGAESDQASGGPAPYGVCIDGVCYVTDEPIDVDPGAVDGVSDVIYTADADAPGRIVCLEGDGECTVVDPSSSVDDLAASSNGRLVHGAIDADPSGTWRTTNLPTRVRCTLTGVGRSDIKVKRTRASGTIERQPDGRLVGQSDRDGEEPFLMARLGPGLYGSVQPFTDGKVTGVVISYFGMLTDDKIEGTSVMTSTLDADGARTNCSMKRNFDMKRISAPAASAGPFTDDAAADPADVAGE